MLRLVWCLLFASPLATAACDVYEDVTVCLDEPEVEVEEPEDTQHTYEHYGDTTYREDGVMYQRMGKFTYGSDGTTCLDMGNTTYCN